MQTALMVLAFAATALLVLTLYPAIIKQTDSEVQSSFVLQPAEWRRVMFFSVLVFGIVLIGLLLFEFAWWIIAIATILTTLLFSWCMYKYILRQKQKKEEFFEDRMLDFLVLVCNNLKSGFALPNSIETAAKSIGGVLGEEFGITLSEYRLGVDLATAISRMNQRVKCENLQLFSATVTVAIRTGSAISTVLERLIFTIRKRNEISDKLKAMTAQFNFEAIMMCILPFIAFGILYLIAPDLMSPMITTGIGWATFAVIIILEITGLQILKKICDVKM